jgi:hypothetical protein
VSALSRRMPILAASAILPARAGPGSGVIHGAFSEGRSRMPIAGTGSGRGPIQPFSPLAPMATPLQPGFDGLRLAMPGRWMPEAVQRKMESLFNASFSDVRIHVGPAGGLTLFSNRGHRLNGR